MKINEVLACKWRFYEAQDGHGLAECERLTCWVYDFEERWSAFAAHAALFIDVICISILPYITNVFGDSVRLVITVITTCDMSRTVRHSLIQIYVCTVYRRHSIFYNCSEADEVASREEEASGVGTKLERISPNTFTLLAICLSAFKNPFCAMHHQAS